MAAQSAFSHTLHVAVTHTVFLIQDSPFNMDTIFWAAFEPVPLNSTVRVMDEEPFCVINDSRP